MLRKRTSFFRFHLDSLGFSAAILCALHCSLLPILFSLGMLSSLQWIESFWVEALLLSTTALFAGFSLIRGYFRSHRQWLIPALGACGFAIFLLGLPLPFPFEIVCTTLGGMLIAVAHVWNWRATHHTA